MITAGERGVAGAGPIDVAVTGDRNLVAPRALIVSVRGDGERPGGASALARSLSLLAAAVAAEWHGESGRRGLYRPAPLPVPLRVVSGPLAGTGRTDTVATAADLLRATPHGRLVVTGPRGAGKTACAILLVDALLRRPLPGEPVPVLLSLASWDPRAEGLRVWIARRLAEDYPRVLAESVSADELASGRHLLPVLDGLEEIAADQRVLALRKIDEAYDSRDPLVLTCTAPEFDTTMADGGAPPAGASVVALGGTPHEAVADYLRPEFGDSAWDEVLPRLAERPGMRRLVGHPLTVALLRTHHEVPGRDPQQLLDAEEFPDAQALESRLLDDVVPAAFSARPADARSANRPRRTWPVPLAEKWLRQLAARTGSGGQLRWWELSDRVLHPRWCSALLGVAVGAVWFGVAMALWCIVGQRRVSGGAVLGMAAAAGFVAVVFAGSFRDGPAAPGLFWEGIERVPGRIRRARMLVALFVGHMVLGGIGISALVALSGLGLKVFNGLETTPEECAEMARKSGTDYCLVPGPVLPGPAGEMLPAPETQKLKPEEATGHHVDWQAFVDFVPTLIAVGLIAAFLVFVCGFLASAPTGAAYPSPRSSLAGARRRVLGTMAMQCLGLAVAAVVLYSLVRPSHAMAWLGVLAIATVVPWTLSRSAWGRYHVAHWVLALRGRVPWRLMAFCSDAHRLEVLRQAGSAYEFRHEALRRRLLPERGAGSPGT